MSGLAAILRRDGGTPSRVALEHMLAALVSGRGFEEPVVVSSPAMAIGCMPFFVTPEEVGGRQPTSDKNENLQIVFDGRIDNREDLQDALALDRTDRLLSDAHLILECYERWETDCFARIIGPFAVILYDGSRRRVVCARDALGDRSLFYRLTEQSFLVASEPAALFANSDVRPELDESSIAAYFAVEVPPSGSTFFRGVDELEPGHCLVVEESGHRLRRYWNPTPPDLSGYKETDFGEHYRELLRTSVISRLRATGSVGVMLSGGLDSTSLLALSAGNSGTQELLGVSWVFDQMKSLDERDYIDPVLAMHGVESLRSSGDDAWPLHKPGEYGTNPNTPEENLYRHLKQRLYRGASDSGCPVLLSGSSADVFYVGWQLWFADLVRSGRLGVASRDLWRQAKKRGVRSVLGVILEILGVQEVRRKRSRRRGDPWLTREARDLISGRDDRLNSGGGAVERRYARRWQAVLGAREAHGISAENFHANRAGIDLRHPYRDRRLVEFMLAVPASQLFGENRGKRIVRDAMEGLLPDRVLAREHPTLLTPLAHRGVREREQERVISLLRRQEAIWPRYVRRETIERILERGTELPVEEVLLWNCAMFELWRERHQWI